MHLLYYNEKCYTLDCCCALRDLNCLFQRFALKQVEILPQAFTNIE